MVFVAVTVLSLSSGKVGGDESSGGKHITAAVLLHFCILCAGERGFVMETLRE